MRVIELADLKDYVPGRIILQVPYTPEAFKAMRHFGGSNNKWIPHQARLKVTGQFPSNTEGGYSLAYLQDIVDLYRERSELEWLEIVSSTPGCKTVKWWENCVVTTTNLPTRELYTDSSIEPREYAPGGWVLVATGAPNQTGNLHVEVTWDATFMDPVADREYISPLPEEPSGTHYVVKSAHVAISDASGADLSPNVLFFNDIGSGGGAVLNFEDAFDQTAEVGTIFKINGQVTDAQGRNTSLCRIQAGTWTQADGTEVDRDTLRFCIQTAEGGLEDFTPRAVYNFNVGDYITEENLEPPQRDLNSLTPSGFMLKARRLNNLDKVNLRLASLVQSNQAFSQSLMRLTNLTLHQRKVLFP